MLRATAAAPPRGGPGASFRVFLMLGLALSVTWGASDARGQIVPPAPRPESARVAAIAEGPEPLAALEAYLARPKLDPDEALAAELARARVLERLGRRSEALSRWRALHAEGVDASAELLLQEGASLQPALLIPPQAGQALRVVLRGEGTGPVGLALYQVDLVRLQAGLGASRGLLAHLRSPPASALRRLAGWSSGGPERGAPSISVSPRPLAAGLYLLVLEARGVRVPVPVRVPSVASLVRRGAGEGIVWVLERGGPELGSPVQGLEFTALDEAGRPGRALGATGSKGATRGLLRYRGEAPWALAWRRASEQAGPGGSLVLIRLLRSRPPGRPALDAWLSSRRLRAEEPFVAWASERDPRRPWELQTPGGQTWVQRTGNRADFDLRLPPWAPAGTWSLQRGGAREALEVAPPATQGVSLALGVARRAKAWEVDLRGALAGGYALAGAEVRWRARLLRAGPVWSPSGARPLAPHAARLEPGPERALGSGLVRLDAEGQARVSFPRPRGEWGVLLVEASTAGPLRAEARVSAVEGPAEAVGVTPAQYLAPSRAPLPLALHWIDREGHGKSRAEFEVKLEAGEHSTTRSVRGDTSGRGRTSFAVDRRGPIRIEAGRLGGRPPRAAVEVWLEDLEQLSAPLAPPPRGIQLLRAAAQPGHEERALARFPRGGGQALRTREGTTLETVEVLTLKRGQLAWTPQAPAESLVLHHYGPEGWAQRQEPWRPEPQPLRLEVAGGVAPIGSPLLVAAEVYRGREPLGALLSLELFSEAEARWRDRIGDTPARAASGVVGLADPALAGSLTSVGAVGSALPAPRRVFARGGLRARGGVLEAEIPTAGLDPGVYWARFEAQASGSRGIAWARCEVRAPWRLRLAAPLHAVVGDEGELVVELEAAQPLPTFFRWEAPGFALGEPRHEGMTPRLGVDPGRSGVALSAAASGRLVFSFRALKPGAHPLRFRVQDGQGATLAELRATLEVRPRGLVWWARQSGMIPAKGRAKVELAMPRGVVPSTARLEGALDPDLLTALLAGLSELESLPGGLRAPLEASLVRLRLPEISLKRRLRTKVAPAPWRLRELLQRVAAQSAWGAPAADLALALLRLQAGGAKVPRALVRGALKDLDPTAPRAALALRLAGRPAPFPATPAGALYRALSEVEGGRVLEEGLLAEVLSSEPSLKDPLDRAELLALLVRLDRARKLQGRLLGEVLAARSGTGWEDPAHAGAALRSLAVLSLRPPPNAGASAKHLEFPAVGVELRLEGKALLKTWSGAGLERWGGPLRYAGRRLAPGSRLVLKTRATQAAVPYSLRAGGVVREEAPAARDEGIAVRRTLTPLRARLGQRVRLRVELSALPAGTRLEVPLPGGCRLATPVLGAALEAGALWIEPQSRVVELDLVARHPGSYRVLPARARAARSGAWGTSLEVQLVVRKEQR